MRHAFFDMDGTLTESRTPMDRDMNLLMESFLESFDVCVVSGARFEQMTAQMPEVIEELATLGQNGNDARSSMGDQLWLNHLTDIQNDAVMNIIAKIHAKLHPERDDTTENRGSQISLSMLGHNAPAHLKAAYDPAGIKRRAIIEELQPHFDRLADVAVQYAIGGTTCIDFYVRTKGENVLAFAEKMEYRKDDCVYLGDALFKGGNDSSLLTTGIECVKVKNVDETKRWMRQALINNDASL